MYLMYNSYYSVGSIDCCPIFNTNFNKLDEIFFKKFDDDFKYNFDI